MPANGFFPHIVSGIGGDVFAVILLLVALALLFAGTAVIRLLAFFVVGLAGAAFGLGLGALLLGIIGALIGGVRDLTHSTILAVIAGLILFIAGVALAVKLMSLVTAFLGGVILYGVLLFFGASPLVAAVLSLLMFVAGFVTQERSRQQSDRWRGGFS
jgi:hypothetical protein